MIPGRLPRAAWIAGGLIACLLWGRGDGAPPAGNGTALIPGQTFRRVYVPADAPQEWPPGRWTPLPLAEFESRWQTLHGDPVVAQNPTIERATYSAVLAQHELRDGVLEWEVRAGSSLPGVLSVEPFSLSTTRLAWNNGAARATPAVWGTTPTGSTVLVVERASGTVQGSWALAGTNLGRGLEFNLQFPPALVSKLSLQVPADLVLTCSSGELAGPTVGAAPGWSTWTLNLGSQLHCRLRAAPRPGLTDRRPLLITRTRTAYIVRPEILRFIADFELESFEASPGTLTLQPDSEIEISAVELGDDTPVAWTDASGPEGHVLRLTLPEPLTPGVQRLQIRGQAAVPQDAVWRMPRLRLADAIETEGQVSLRLQSPFQASDIEMQGYRQIEFNTQPAEGETLSLRQIRSDASVSVIPASVRARAASRSITFVHAEGDEWRLTSNLEIRGSTKDPFETTCRLPAGWYVTSIGGASDEPAANLANWRLHPDGTQGTRIQLEFRNALDSVQAQRITIEARRAPPIDGAAERAPLVVCDEIANVDVLTLIDGGAGVRPVLTAAHRCAPVTVGDLPSDVQELANARGFLRDNAARLLAVRGVDAAMSAEFQLRPTRGSVPPMAAAGETAISVTSPGDGQPRSQSPLILNVQGTIELADGDAFDVYQLEALLNLKGDEPAIVWRLPQNCELLEAHLDGRATPIEVHAGQYRLPTAKAGGPESAEEHRLRLTYRIPATAPRLVALRQVVLPEFDLPVLQCDITLAAPRELTVRESGNAGYLTRLSGPESRWLGPLSRPTREVGFVPFKLSDWQTLWHSVLSTQVPAESDALSPGSLWRLKSLSLPESIALETWNGRTVTALAWMLAALGLVGTAAARKTHWRRLRRCGILLMAFLTALLWLPHPVANELAGAAFLGTLLGILLPERWLLARHVPVGQRSQAHSGSTQSYALAPLTLFIVCSLLLAAGQGPAAAQGPTSTPAAHARGQTVDVLIPVDNNGKPRGAPPLCYVLEPVLRSLSEKSHSGMPAWLIRSARYHARVADARHVECTAEFNITLLTDREQATLELPFQDVVLRDRDSCRIDGRPQRLRLGPQGRSLLVDLRVGPPSGAGTSEEIRPTPPRLPLEASDRLTAATHVVELRFLLPAESPDSGRFAAHLSLPSVSDALATLEVSTETRQPEISRLDAGPAIGRGVTSPDGQAATTASLGRATDLYLRWQSSNAEAADKPAELEASVVALFDVSPRLLRAEYRVDYRPVTGRAQSVVWQLPAGWSLESLAASGQSGYLLEPGERNGRRLRIEFSEPISAPQVVSVRLARARVHDLEEELLALAAVATNDPFTTKVSLRSYHVGFRQAVDYRLSVSAAEANLPLKPVTADDFSKLHTFDGARPQQTYEVARAGNLIVSLQDLSSQIRANTESHGRFSPGRLDWSFVAEIEKPEIPAFMYRLEIDPRLEIDKVSVQEDGAERLSRWSQTDGKLVLFLNDRAGRAHTVRIEGAIPFATPTSLDLPRTRLIGATVTTDRTMLSRPPDLSLVIAAPAQAAGAGAGLKEMASLPARAEFAAREAPLRVEVMAVGPTVSAETITVAPRTTSDSWRLAATWQISSGRTNHFECELSERFYDRARLQSSPAATFVERSRAGGRVQLVCYTTSPLDGQFRLLLEAPAGTAEMSPSGDYLVPTIIATEVSPQAGRVIVPAHGAELVGTVLPLPLEAQEDWRERTGIADFDPAEWLVAAMPADAQVPLSYRFTRAAEEHQEAAIRLIDGTLRWDGDRLTGRLALWFDSRPPHTLSLEWPDRAQLVAALIDGRPLAIGPLQQGKYQLDLSSAARGSIVMIQWSQPDPPPPQISGDFFREIPWPHDASIARAVVEARLPFASSGQGFQGRSVLGNSLLRWQTTLEALGPRANPAPRVQAALRNVLLHQEAASRQMIDRLGAQATPTVRVQADQLAKATRGFEQSDRAESTAEGPLVLLVDAQQPELDEAALVSHTVTAHYETPGRIEVTGWSISRRLLSVLLAIVGAVVVLLVGRPLSHPIAWLQRREGPALIVLGLLWWTLLQPGVAGPCLVLAGVFCWWRSRLATTSPAPSASTVKQIA